MIISEFWKFLAAPKKGYLIRIFNRISTNNGRIRFFNNASLAQSHAELFTSILRDIAQCLP